MTFKQHQTESRTPVFRNQNVVYGQWFLPIICEITVILSPFSTAWALLTPCFIALIRLAKITFGDFEFNKSSNVFYDRAKSINRPHPIQSISTSVQFIIGAINSSTGKLSS